MSQWWSWVLAAFGLTGIWLAGRKKRAGWLIGVLTQLLWITYGVTTRQWGFIVTALAYAAMYLNNWHAWRAPKQLEGQP